MNLLRLAACGLALSLPGLGNAAEFWVAADGHDDAAGTAAAPFATPARALRAARELRRLDPPARVTPVYILLRGGEHTLTEPVFIRPEDSGSPGAPTVLKAAPGERPVLSGGIAVAGWSKLDEAPAGLPPGARGRVWTAPVPAFNGRPLLFRQLWVDGNLDRPAQPIDVEALDEVVGSGGFAVEQQILSVAPHKEVEQALALRRKESGPHRKIAGDVARHEALEEPAHVLARQADDGAVGQGGCGHDHQLGSRPWHRKR